MAAKKAAKKHFEVWLTKSESWDIQIDAESAEEAEKIAMNHLDGGTIQNVIEVEEQDDEVQTYDS